MSSEERSGEEGCGLNSNREQELVGYCWFGGMLREGPEGLCSEVMHVASRNNVFWKNGGFVTEIFTNRSAVLWKIGLGFFFLRKKCFLFPHGESSQAQPHPQ